MNSNLHMHYTNKFWAVLLLWALWPVASMHAAPLATTDSLVQKIKTVKDTALVDLYNEISYQFRNADIEKSLQYADTALWLSKKINYTRGVGNSFVNRGNYFKITGNSTEAKNCYVWAYVQHQKIGNQKGISSTLNCIASLHFLEGDLTKALAYFIQSLNISQAIKDRRGEAITQNNIGVINLEQRNFSKALEYYEGAYNTFKEINDQHSMADALNNIGNVYHTQGLKNEALKYYNMAKELNEVLGNIKGVASVINNIGTIHYENKEYKQALKYYHNSLAIDEKLNDKQSRTISYNNIANCYHYLDMNFAAKKYAEQALKSALEQNDKIDLVNTYDILSKIEDKLGNYKEALVYVKNYNAYRDSLYSEESRQKLENIEAQYQAEKAENERLLQALEANQLSSSDDAKAIFTPLNWSILIGVVLLAAIILFYVVKLK